jgi:TRIC channel
MERNAMDTVVAFLTGASAFSAENQSFWMAVQGAMAVRKGPNKDKRMNWFHAFVQSVLIGFSGGLFGFLWMGKPSAMLYNDLNMASCIIAFVLVNYTPFDIGFKVLDTLPFAMITVSFAQLFRATGLIKFVNVCYEEFKGIPSKYYPIPVFGPILYGTVCAPYRFDTHSLIVKVLTFLCSVSNDSYLEIWGDFL